MKKISERFGVENYPQFEVYQLVFKAHPKGGSSPASYDEESGNTYVAVTYKSAKKFAEMVLGKRASTRKKK